MVFVREQARVALFGDTPGRWSFGWPHKGAMLSLSPRWEL